MFRIGTAIVSPGGWTRHGGIEVYARTIVRKIQSDMPDRQATLIDSRGEGSVPASFPIAWRAARDVVALARAGKADVAHLQVSERSSFLRKGYILRRAKAAGMYTVLHHHGADLIPWYHRVPAPMQAWVRATIHAAHVNVVLGQPWRTFMIEELGLPDSQVVIAYNGIPDLDTPPAPLTVTPDHPFRPLLLAVLSDRKGVGDYLQALKGLSDVGIPFEATVAGGGPDLPRFQKMAVDLGVADRCTFPGWVAPENVPAALAEHDVYVLPSYREGLPIGIIEAMRAARPVIATTVGSIPEAIPAGYGVKLNNPGDIPALTASLIRLAQSPDVRIQDGTVARALYLSRFSLTSHLERLLPIYKGETPPPYAM